MTPAQARKRRERLTVNIQHVIDSGGMSHAFVGTFTTRANLSMNEFQSIWNSFVTDVLVRRLGQIGADGKRHFHGVGVIEPQERGAPHIHLAARVEDDIATGVKWFQRRWGGRRQWVIARQSKPIALAHLQAFLMRSWDAHVRSKTRQSEKKISNAHCMPVRTCARAAAAYLASYLEKGEARLGEWKGRKLYREYGASRSRNENGEVVVNSPHPCRGKFTRFAVQTKDGYKVREYTRLWRLRVAAFALEFGCSSLAELMVQLGDSALYDHRELIGRMLVPEVSCGDFQQACRSVNRASIEAAGYNPDLRAPPQSKSRSRGPSRVSAFASSPSEKFWSGAADTAWDGKSTANREGELFPDRVIIISREEAALLAWSRSRGRAG